MTFRNREKLTGLEESAILIVFLRIQLAKGSLRI